MGLSQSKCSTKLDLQPAFLPLSDEAVRGPWAPEGIPRLSDQPMDTGWGRGGEGRGPAPLPPRRGLLGLSATNSAEAKVDASWGPALPRGVRRVSSPLQPQSPLPASRETWAQGSLRLPSRRRARVATFARHSRGELPGHPHLTCWSRNRARD